MHDGNRAKKRPDRASPAAGGNAADGPTVACPHCGKPALYAPANRFRPFCSERCRLIDLGAWASENYRIPDSAPADGTLDDDGGER